MVKAIFFLGFLSLFFCLTAQPSNDNCANSEELCPNLTYSGSTVNATTTVSSDNTFCFITSGTVWYSFTTDADGGDVSVDITNLNFDPDPAFGQEIDAIIYEVNTPCDQTSYVDISNCGSGSMNFALMNTIALAANTTYYVQINGRITGAGVTDPAACSFDIAISGTAVDKPTPMVTISDPNTDWCLGESGTPNAVITNCADTASFEWLYDGNVIATGTSNDFDKAILPQTGSLELVITCGSICPQKDTSNTIDYVITQINADAGPDKFIAQGDQVMIDGAGLGIPVWSPATSLTNPSVFQPIANPNVTTSYFLTVTEGACIKTDVVIVNVGELVTIYSSFTPNGDDINDKWVIRNSPSFPNMEVSVYDRSGQLVFNTVNYSSSDKFWDGTFKGNELPSSTYYYVINLKQGDESIFKGPVTIIR